MKNTEKITAAIRSFFLLTFALLAVIGMSEAPQKRYVPQVNSEAVFSKTVYAQGTAESSDGDEIYVMGAQDRALPTVSARSAALLSADTGELIYGKNSNLTLPMASTTKIMTALVVLESGVALDSVFTVPKAATGIEGSSIYLFEGEKITVKDLLYGLLLESGNDAATALALCCAQDEESFVQMMNQKAKQLGLTSTSFANPHGLSAQNHHTSALELGKITYHAMKHPIFREICKTKSYSTTPVSEEFPVHYFVNHNKMLRTFQGATGVKTGYTAASGRCLVSSADRGEGEFIAVTLDDRDDWRDHAQLLEYAFSQYAAKKLLAEGELSFTLGGREYVNKQGVTVLLTVGQGIVDGVEVFLS